MNDTAGRQREVLTGASRYFYLLAALVGFLVLSPFVHGRAGRWLLPLALTAVLLGVVLAASGRRSVFRLALGLAALPLVATAARAAFPGQNSVIVVSLALMAAFLPLAAAAILRDVFQGMRVTNDKILGAICAFLLIGVVWAFLYALTEIAQPGSFRGSALDAGLPPANRMSTSVYFSFVTLTTLGYGDLSPVSQIARTLAFLEAITGQLYLTILIARLVGLHLSSSSRRAE